MSFRDTASHGGNPRSGRQGFRLTAPIPHLVSFLSHGNPALNTADALVGVTHNACGSLGAITPVLASTEYLKRLQVITTLHCP